MDLSGEVIQRQDSGLETMSLDPLTALEPDLVGIAVLLRTTLFLAEQPFYASGHRPFSSVQQALVLETRCMSSSAYCSHLA